MLDEIRGDVATYQASIAEMLKVRGHGSLRAEEAAELRLEVAGMTERSNRRLDQIAAILDRIEARATAFQLETQHQLVVLQEKTAELLRQIICIFFFFINSLPRLASDLPNLFSRILIW